jgi:hypothetical protein
MTFHWCSFWLPLYVCLDLTDFNESRDTPSAICAFVRRTRLVLVLGKFSLLGAAVVERGMVVLLLVPLFEVLVAFDFEALELS